MNALCSITDSFLSVFSKIPFRVGALGFAIAAYQLYTYVNSYVNSYVTSEDYLFKKSLSVWSEKGKDETEKSQRRSASERILRAYLSQETSKTLDLNHLKIGELPEEIRKIKNIRTMNLIHCGLTQLPAWLADNHSLESVKVHGNRIGNLPEELFKRSENLISGLPDDNRFVKNLHKDRFLRSLLAWLESNDGSPFNNKQIAIARILECYKPDFKELNLKKLGLRTLPDCLGKLSHLTDVDISENMLESIPDLTRLTFLQNLIVGKTDSPELIVSLVENINEDRLPFIQPSSIRTRAFEAATQRSPKAPNLKTLLVKWAREFENSVPRIEWGRDPIDVNNVEKEYRSLFIDENSYKSETLYLFLHKLLYTEDYHHPRSAATKKNLIITVDFILREAAKNTSFRRAMGIHLETAVISCQDAAAAGLDTINILKVLYTEKISDDIDFAKIIVGWRRLHILKAQADSYFNPALPAQFDAVLIYLGLAFALKEAFNLPLFVKDMHYERLSHIYRNVEGSGKKQITKEGVRYLQTAIIELKKQTSNRDQILAILCNSDVSHFWIERLKVNPRYAPRFEELATAHISENQELENRKEKLKEGEYLKELARLKQKHKEENEGLVSACTLELLDKNPKSAELLAPNDEVRLSKDFIL